MTTTRIQPGDFVSLENTVGQATPTPTTRTVEGYAALDDEGTLRVDGVNVERDDDGYFPRGVVILTIKALS